MSGRFLISMSSWEPRFRLGIQHLISAEKISGLAVFSSKEFVARTDESVKKVLDDAKDAGVPVRAPRVMDFLDQVDSYTTVETELSAVSKLGHKKFVIDISTMPREIVWCVFRIAGDIGVDTEFVYFPPEAYGDGWLTRDPSIPRLALRNSGISRSGRPTALVIVTGFDSERTLKAINFFEPAKVMLGVQSGDQYENLHRNVEEQRLQLRPEFPAVETFAVDAYSADFGYSQLKSICDELSLTHNVLLTSQGPKPSSIAAFRLSMTNPAVGLYYLPSLEYSDSYSRGIDLQRMVRGSVPAG